MPTLRERLLAMLGAESATDADLQKQLDALKTESLLDALATEGVLSADEAAREAARLFAQSDPERLKTLLRAQRPTPAAAHTLIPPSAPADQTEDAIQNYMKAHSVPYHDAAAAVVTDVDI